MKLTSHCLRVQIHLKDLDEAGLLTRAVDESLPEALRARLARVRTLK